MGHMGSHMSMIRWAVKITPETFQEASAGMNEGLCPVQTLHLHLCISVAAGCVILIPSVLPWKLITVLTALLQTFLWHPVNSEIIVT